MNADASNRKPRPPRSSRVARLAFLASAAVVAAACAKVAGIDDLEIGECKGGSPCVSPEAGFDTSTMNLPETSGPLPDSSAPFDASALPCTSAHGPTMVRVGTTANNFCIDSSEVTVGQYAEFTKAVGADAGGQPPECAWNASYAAALGGTDDIPIAGIDWCDARAFCAWSGKRLCGKHENGKFTGKVSVDDLGDFTTHEWLLTCSKLGQLRYPYGGIQNGKACNTGEYDAGKTLPVKSLPGCNGGFDGVYDMVGNLWEWFDGPCLPPDAGGDAAGVPDAGPAKEECFVKGGAFLNTGVALDCRVDGRGATRDRRGIEIGFRCCSD